MSESPSESPAGSSSVPGARPQPLRPEFITHEAATNWLDPRQLLRTGLLAWLAGAIGSFTDSRVLQATRQPGPTGRQQQAEQQLGAQRDALWIDYVADTGDGWDATSSVAWALGRPALEIGGDTLPRAGLLLMGGDQVYPTPAGNAYRTRLLDPLRSALPDPSGGEAGPLDAQRPLLLAIPGNHDWYDGLRGFHNVFCSEQPLGAWQTVQRQSYWAVALPHDWWLWGIDLQLDAELDQPQYEYFQEQARRLTPSSRVLLMLPEPSWIEDGAFIRSQTADDPAGRDGDGARTAQVPPQSARSRSWKRIEALVTARNARIAATLAGDRHHYARYAPDASVQAADGAPAQRITCGGGGAFLLGTHQLPEELPMRHRRGQHPYRLAKAYPPKSESERLRDRAALLPIRNPLFALTLGLFHLVWIWLLQSASVAASETLGQPSLFTLAAQQDGPGGWWRVLQAVSGLTGHAPAAMVWAALLVGGAAMFTRSGADHPAGQRAATACGALHGVLHLLLAVTLIWLLARLNLRLWFTPDFDRSLGHALLVGLEVVLAGGLGGGLLFGLWLMLVNRLAGWHGQEVFSSQAIPHWRSWLRMCITPEGLTIHPLGIREACTRWQPGASWRRNARRSGRTWRLLVPRGATQPRFEPQTPIRVERIEAPIVIR